MSALFLQVSVWSGSQRIHKAVFTPGPLLTFPVPAFPCPGLLTLPQALRVPASPYCKALVSVQKATACFLGAWLVQGGVGQVPMEALNVHTAGSGFWVPSGKTVCLYDYFCGNGLGCSPVANRGIYNRNTHFLLGPENIHIIHLLTSRALLIHHLYMKLLANTTLAVLRLFFPHVSQLQNKHLL